MKKSFGEKDYMLDISAHFGMSLVNTGAEYTEREYLESIGELGYPYINIVVSDVEESCEVGILRMLFLPAFLGTPYDEFLDVLDMYSQEVCDFSAEAVHSEAFSSIYYTGGGCLECFYEEGFLSPRWIGYIDRLYIDEDYRRRGIASYLIDNLPYIVELNMGDTYLFRVVGLMPCPLKPYYNGELYRGGPESSFATCCWNREDNENLKREMIKFDEAMGFVKNGDSSQCLFKVVECGCI